MEEFIEEKERELDIRQYFLYVWDHIGIVLIVAILIAGAMGGFGYLKKSKNSPESKSASLTEIIVQNHNKGNGLNNVKSFTDTETPNGAFVVSTRLFIDYDFSSIEGNGSLDYSAMVNKLQQDAVVLLLSDEAKHQVIEQLNLHNYDDMKNLSADDLRWMVSFLCPGANVIQYSVTDVNEERALKIAEVFKEEFIKNSKDFSTIDSVKVIDEPNVVKGHAIAAGTGAFSVSTLAKYAVIGGVAGVILMFGLYLMLFLLQDNIRISKDLEYLNLDMFGRVPYKGDFKAAEYRRIAYNMSLLPDNIVLTIAPIDEKSDAGVLAENVQEELKKIGRNAKVIDCKDSGVEQLTKEVKNSKEKADITLITVNNIKKSPDATLAAANSDGVVLCAAYGKTSLKTAGFAKSEMEKSGSKILGVVVTGARHI